MTYSASVNPFFAARRGGTISDQAPRRPTPAYARLPLAPINASPVPHLTSLYHNSRAGDYGDRGYPGNCGGNLIKDLLLYFQPGLVFDPMAGSGTCRDVCNELDIPCLSWDIHDGFDACDPILAQQFPILFVDESQDTAENVVLALKAVDQEFGDQFCVGFFGDPMQRIYMTGIGEIPPGRDWTTITKAENFRCPTTVLNVANAIRRDGDGLVQTRGRMEGPSDTPVSVPGSANISILPIDDRRDQRIAQVRAWTAERTGDPAWNIDASAKAVKVLVIVHRMAAKRLAFGDLYAALNDKAPEKFKNGFLDGTAWPVRPFNRFVLPLVNALKAGNEFEAMQVLRKQSPLLARENISKSNVVERLRTRGAQFQRRSGGFQFRGSS